MISYMKPGMYLKDIKLHAQKFLTNACLKQGLIKKEEEIKLANINDLISKSRDDSDVLVKDVKAKDDKPLEVVDAYVRENTTELVDPIKIESVIAKLTERKDSLLRELETQIKVSNATTFIEI